MDVLVEPTRTYTRRVTGVTNVRECKSLRQAISYTDNWQRYHCQFATPSKPAPSKRFNVVVRQKAPPWLPHLANAR